MRATLEKGFVGMHGHKTNKGIVSVTSLAPTRGGYNKDGRPMGASALLLGSMPSVGDRFKLRFD